MLTPSTCSFKVSCCTLSSVSMSGYRKDCDNLNDIKRIISHRGVNEDKGEVCSIVSIVSKDAAVADKVILLQRHSNSKLSNKTSTLQHGLRINH